MLGFAFVTSAESAITTTGALAREYIVMAIETEGELKQANEVGNLGVDVSALVAGIIGH